MNSPTQSQMLYKKLCPGDRSTQRQEYLKREQIPTLGSWFLAEKPTLDWLNCHPLFWAYGPSATGKTFISSLLVEHIRSTQSVASQNIATAVFYFQSHLDRQHNVVDFNYALSSIARQLIAQLSGTATKALQLEKELTNWHIDSELLRRIISSFDSTFIIFDGVDASARAFRDLLADIFQLPTEELHLHIFITSRYPPPRFIIDQFQVSTAEIRASDEDLTKYLLQGSEGLVAPEQQQEFSEAVSNLAKLLDGRYPPSVSQTFSLHEEASPLGILAELVNALTITPASAKVGVLCEFAITQIKKSRHGRLLYIVHRLVAEMEQFGYTLTRHIIAEILEAFGIQRDIEPLYSMDKDQEHAAFIMLSGRDQILQSQSPLLRDHLAKERSREFKEELVQASLRYMSLKEFSGGPCPSSMSLKERFQRHPFLPYAARILSTSATRFQIPPDIIELFTTFSSCCGSIESYLQARNSWPYLDDTTYDELEDAEERWRFYPLGYRPLHLACDIIGGKYLIEALLQRGEDINARTENGQTALHIVAEIESDSNTLAALLENGADVSATDNDGEMPLSIAVVHGCLDSVKLLLQYGADIGTIPSDVLLECTEERPEIAEFLAIKDERLADVENTGED